MSRWNPSRHSGKTKIARRERKCDLCGERFQSGMVSVERGYIVSAACTDCSKRAALRGVTIDDARTPALLTPNSPEPLPQE